MTDDMTAMSHENDGGTYWHGPICGPSFTWLPDEIQQVINERINTNRMTVKPDTATGVRDHRHQNHENEESN